MAGRGTQKQLWLTIFTMSELLARQSAPTNAFPTFTRSLVILRPGSMVRITALSRNIFRVIWMSLFSVSIGVKRPWPHFKPCWVSHSRKSPCYLKNYAAESTGKAFGLNPRHLLASGGGPIQGIEYKHHVFLPLELTQGKILFSQMTGQFKIRSLFPYCNHKNSPSRN